MPTPRVRPHRATRALIAAAVLIGAPVCAQAQDALPLHLFGYDRNAPLDLQTQALEEREGVAISTFSFASPKGGRASGRLFVPQGRGPFAGVILAHGAPGNAVAFTGRGIYIAKHGAVVVVVDAPFNRREGGMVTLSSRDSADQVQLVVDLQRAVDLLIARPDVDSTRLAYVGRSYGAATGALFAGVERRLKTYVLASGDGGMTARFRVPGAPRPPVPEAEFRAWLASMDPIEGYRFIGRANAPILFQHGRRDAIVPVTTAEQLHALVPGAKEVRWYDAEHALNPAAYVDQLRWLSQQVGTTPPGPEDEAGPEIPPPPQPGPQPRPRP